VTAFARPELLATTDWLVEQLARPDLRILDVRWRPDGSGAAVFAAGHLPNAVHLDWRTELIEPDDADAPPGLRLAGPERVAAALGRAGVGDGTSLVIYDDSLGLYAARTWWSLRVYGYDSARVLDGGYPAWAAASRPLSNASYPPPPAVFTPRTNPRLRLTTADVSAALGSPDVLLVDARASAEYRGLEGNSRRLGHIPGAVNLPVGGLHVPGTQRLRDAATIRDMVLAANVIRGRRIVTYDGSGIAAARLAYVLTLLGYEDVAVYDGGWSEWGHKLDLPVER
jgi:thiosulfate/3-mercaptopyruvate sulfurtransferase